MKFGKKKLTGCAKYYNQVCVQLFFNNIMSVLSIEIVKSFSLYSLNVLLSINCVLIVLGDIICTRAKYFDKKK